MKKYDVDRTQLIYNDEYITCPYFDGKVIGQTNDSYLILPASIKERFSLLAFWLKKVNVNPYRKFVYTDSKTNKIEKVSYLASVIDYAEVSLHSLSHIIQQYINQSGPYRKVR
jgi:hypothetical protein